MNTARKVDMSEATRLTRLGRLTEAMAVLRGDTPAPAPSDTPSPAAVEPGPTLIEMRPPAKPGGVWTSPFASAAGRPAKSPGATRAAPAAARPARADLSKARFPAPTLPPGARFGEAVFSDAHGRCAYKLYVPSGYDGRPVPLVVMLHGCTQSPDDFAAGTGMNALAEEQGFLVAYPAQTRSANASRCWNWFEGGHQRRDEGEPALIAGVTRQILGAYSVDAGRVYIAGLSAGGAAAAIMGQAYPDLYAAIGVHSGLACGAAKDMPSAFAAMSQGAGKPARRNAAAPLPTIVFHGDADHTVSPVNGDQVIAQSKGGVPLRTTVTTGASTGGVTYRRIVHADDQGVPQLEQWDLHGAGHAWSGGSSAGSYTDPAGPDASREMLRFFLQHRAASRR